VSTSSDQSSRQPQLARAAAPSPASATTAAEISDYELLRRTAAGDREGFGVLVRRHQARVIALAQRFLGRPEAAEDVCQDAFLRVFETARSFNPEAQFSTWLYRIVANLCWDARRRVRRERRMSWRAVPVAPQEIGTVARNEIELAVRRAVAELPDRQRLVLILHRFEGLGHREIAAITGCSVGSIESCLVRAYATLRARLTRLDAG
jgi:RNA polymerase sigma-70 factor (ECF subfamily)